MSIDTHSTLTSVSPLDLASSDDPATVAAVLPDPPQVPVQVPVAGAGAGAARRPRKVFLSVCFFLFFFS